MNDTLIIGVGNPLRSDDGVGLRVVELLAEHDLPPEVKLTEAGTPGLGLTDLLEGWARVIIIDAAHLGQAPGTWRRLTPAEVKWLAPQNVFSLHDFDLASGLALAQALGTLPAETVIFGVEPAACEPGPALSPAVKNALPELVASILTEVRKKTI